MPQVWKVSPLGRFGSLAWVVLMAVFAFLTAGPVAGAAVLVVGLAAVWRFAFWPALTLTGTDVVVRNPWGTRRVPLGDVAGTGGAYAGLSIRRRSGGAVTAWAVQKPNAAKWSGKTSRADEVAAAVMAAAGRVQVEHAS